MKVGERGQVTIPKDIREKFDIRPNADVSFEVVNGSIVLRKAIRKIGIARPRSASPPNANAITFLTAMKSELSL